MIALDNSSAQPDSQAQVAWHDLGALAKSTKVNLRRARLVYWDGRPCPGSIPGAGHSFRYV